MPSFSSAIVAPSSVRSNPATVAPLSATLYVASAVSIEVVLTVSFTSFDSSLVAVSEFAGNSTEVFPVVVSLIMTSVPRGVALTSSLSFVSAAGIVPVASAENTPSPLIVAACTDSWTVPDTVVVRLS